MERYTLAFRIMNLIKNDNTVYNYMVMHHSFMIMVLNKLKELKSDLSRNFKSLYIEYFDPLIKQIEMKMDIENIDIENKKN
jgi:hypothetical protein